MHVSVETARGFVRGRDRGDDDGSVVPESRECIDFRRHGREDRDVARVKRRQVVARRRRASLRGGVVRLNHPLHVLARQRRPRQERAR